MQPRGQLWFELEKVCKDFLEFSGLSRKEGLEIMLSVLGNMHEAVQGELDTIKGASPAGET